MTVAMTKANTRHSGERTAMRMIIMNAIWTLLMSVVRRVTSELELNSSMLAKLKRWML